MFAAAQPGRPAADGFGGSSNGLRLQNSGPGAIAGKLSNGAIAVRNRRRRWCAHRERSRKIAASPQPFAPPTPATPAQERKMTAMEPTQLGDAAALGAGLLYMK